jgi:hypothetical protein
LSYQWFRNGQPLIDGGNVSGSRTPTLTFTPLQGANVGRYTVRIFDVCGQISSPEARVFPEFLCYGNCDASTVTPVLNVDDFVCFLSRFAAADPWADCTHDQALNVDDLVCFQSSFAAGCQ